MSSVDVARVSLGLIAILWILWGGLIVVDIRFYNWWRDHFWRETNKGELSTSSTINNRYVNAGGLALLGIFILYLIVFRF